jgi:hypothetical protein
VGERIENLKKAERGSGSEKLRNKYRKENAVVKIRFSMSKRSELLF